MSMVARAKQDERARVSRHSRARLKVVEQCDQIGRNFAIWAKRLDQINLIL
jgi:hypothetical protein